MGALHMKNNRSSLCVCRRLSKSERGLGTTLQTRAKLFPFSIIQIAVIQTHSEKKREGERRKNSEQWCQNCCYCFKDSDTHVLVMEELLIHNGSTLSLKKHVFTCLTHLINFQCVSYAVCTEKERKLLKRVEMRKLIK